MSNKYLEKIALYGHSIKEKLDSSAKRFHMDTWSHYSSHLNKNIEEINKGVDGRSIKAKDYVDHAIKSMKGNKEMYSSYKPIHEKFVKGMKTNTKKYDSSKMDHKASLDSFIDHMGKTYRKSL